MGYLNELAVECHQTSKDHGFWGHQFLGTNLEVVNPSIWAEKIALMHSEASEMLECLRKNKDEDELSLECADLLIRLLDFTGARNIDLDQAVLMKMAINKNRGYLHGRNF